MIKLNELLEENLEPQFTFLSIPAKLELEKSNISEFGYLSKNMEGRLRSI